MSEKSCLTCKHLDPEIWNRCKAFPEGIPYEIISGEFDHVVKHPEQTGDYIYELKDEEESE